MNGPYTPISGFVHTVWKSRSDFNCKSPCQWGNLGVWDEIYCSLFAWARTVPGTDGAPDCNR